jgi:hypothetical protein
MFLGVYKASMARTPRAPATPEPTTAVGYEAPPCDGVEDGAAELAPPVEARVAEDTVLITVELPPTGELLMLAPVPVATEEGTVTIEVETTVAVAVVVATLVAGYSLGK